MRRLPESAASSSRAKADSAAMQRGIGSTSVGRWKTLAALFSNGLDDEGADQGLTVWHVAEKDSQ